jgi:signal peptidase II
MHRKPWIPAALIAGIVLIDQFTKQLVLRTMELGENIVVIPGFFTITSHRNTGAAWGILDGNMTFFYAITVVSGVLFYLLWKDEEMKHKTLYTLGITLMVAGGIGNFIDRLLFQEVVDFFNVDLWSYTTFPIFNIADISLVVGMIAFAVDILWEEVFGWIRSKSQPPSEPNE